jgi:HEAT repeat protein
MMKGLAESNQANKVVEYATIAIALHDDPRASDVLKTLVRKSTNREVRRTAVHWLGFIGVETSFLADLIRNESEDGEARTHQKPEVRKQAIFWLGRTGDARALAFFEELLGK